MLINCKTVIYQDTTTLNQFGVDQYLWDRLTSDHRTALLSSRNHSILKHKNLVKQMIWLLIASMERLPDNGMWNLYKKIEIEYPKQVLFQKPWGPCSRIKNLVKHKVWFLRPNWISFQTVAYTHTKHVTHTNIYFVGLGYDNLALVWMNQTEHDYMNYWDYWRTYV